MVWQYLKEPPIEPAPTPEDLRNEEVVGIIAHIKGQYRGNLLLKLSIDPSLAKWLLPLIRQRMKWMTGEIERGRTAASVSMSEFSGIQVYFYRQGTVADLASLEALFDQVLKAGFLKGELSKREPLEQHLLAMDEAKADMKRHGHPYWQSSAFYLEGHGLLDPAGPDLLPQKMEPTLPNFSNQPKTADRNPAKIPSGAPTSSALWSIGLGMIAAAAWLLWLVFKRRKRS